MRVPDHYAALGVQSTADASDIRKAYKKRALQTHPDKGGDEEEFKRVGAAYAVLSDEAKRRDYDEMRTDGLRQGERNQTDYQARASTAPSTRPSSASAGTRARSFRWMTRARSSTASSAPRVPSLILRRQVRKK